MSMRNLLPRVLKKFFSMERLSKQQPFRRFRPRLELLEDRVVPTIFLVNNILDSGTDSFRDAITQANLSTGPDQIQFNVAGSIQLLSVLPAITDTVNIEGDTAPGYAGTPALQVNYNGFAGLNFAAGSAGSALRSLGHVNASTAGVTLNESGILLVGNYIGLQLDGSTIAGNIGGVQINSNSNTIGIASLPRNVISGNAGNGITITGATGNTISGNYIGTGASGTLARGNTLDGVSLDNSDNNLIGQVASVTYYNADQVSTQPVNAWQGIRASDTSDQYLIVGTSGSNGLLFDGTISGLGTTSAVNFPGADSTSVYGPENLPGSTLRLVGSYKESTNPAVTVNGFLFDGTTADLTTAANYRTIDHPGAQFNYVHSTMGGLAVGNYDSASEHGTFSLPLGPGHAYIYDIAQDTFLTDVVYPGSLSNTAYGIWHNGGTSYTIVGGYSLDPVNNLENPGQPFGQAYMVDYDSVTGVFSNWASYDYPNGINYVTHFEGISSVEPGVYTLNADSVQSGSSNPAQGSFVTVTRNTDGTFGNATWADLNYPGPNPATNITSSNAVFGNQVVGVVIGPDSGFSFQATVNPGFERSNVVSGNGGNGIGLYGANSNQIAMNYIGTDATGAFDLGNSLSGVVLTTGSQGNLIGGSATGGNDPTGNVFVRPPQGNLISGNDVHGVFITGNATLNTLSGNFIGTDASGNSPLGNDLDGVSILNADGNSLIGCTIQDNPFVFYNVIGGNGGNGLRVTDSDDTTIQANFFGMGANNNTALGNGLDGVLVEGTSARTLMGGPIPLGNVVAANAGNGIVVKDTASFFTSYNSFVGLAAFSDVLTFGNGLNGMLITSSGSDILIRTNVIARNGDNGIEISGAANGVRVVGNIIGLNTNGTIPMGNVRHGVEIGGSATNILIGGPQPTFNIIPQNVISANGASGVAVVGNANGIQINSSYIGTDVFGIAALGNAESGVFLGADSHTTIGSIDPDFLTVISGNLGGGVVILDSTGNTIVGSLIGTTANGLSSLPNAGDAIYVAGVLTTTLTISANTIEGGNSTSASAGIRLISNLPASAEININQNFITGFPYAIKSDNLANGITVTVFNNSMAGSSIRAIDSGIGALINASGNWWGINTPAGVAAQADANVDYTPWLEFGVDTDPIAPGFQGDFSILNASAASPQVGATGRITEAIGLLADGSLLGGARVVQVISGAYSEDVDATSKALTFAIGAGPGQVTLDGNFTLDINDTFAQDMAGYAAGSGFDQLNVNGIITLGNATLVVIDTLNNPVTIAPPFTIIGNDPAGVGGDTVIGVFTIPGSTVGADGVTRFNRNGHVYAISYDFGTAPANGNDVVLSLDQSSLLVFQDDFNRSNSPNLGSNWTTQVGSVSIFSNTAVTSLDAVSLATVNDVSLLNTIVQADIAVPNANGARAGLVARYSGPGENNFYLGMVYNSNGLYEAHIWLKTSAYTLLAIQPLSNFSGAGILRLEVVGKELKLFVNNILTAVAYDSTLSTAGMVGVRGVAGTFDNFVASSYAVQIVALPYSDSFTNADNSDLDPVWTERADAFTIQGNTAVPASLTDVSLATLNTATTADVIVQADVNVSTSLAGAGLVARYTGPDNGNYYLGMVYNNNGAYQAYLFVNSNGAFTQLAVQTLSSLTGDFNLRFEVVGNQQKLFVNNVLCAVVYNTTLAAPGQVGMRGFASRHDNLDASAVVQQFGTLPQFDSFTKPNNSSLDRIWTERIGAFTTQSNRAADAANLAPVSLATLNGVSVANVSVQANVALAGNGSGAGLVARYSGPGQSNFYLGMIYNNNGVYQALIFLNQGGAFTQLAVQNLPGFTGTGTLRFDVTESSLKLFVDNVQKASATNAALTGPGLVGIRSASASFDDFNVQ